MKDKLYGKLPEGYSPLYVKRVGSRHWEVARDWVTPYGVVKKGFVSNGASVPRPLWSLASPAGSLFEAACLHDYRLSVPVKGDSSHLRFKQVSQDFKVNRALTFVSYHLVRLNGLYKYLTKQWKSPLHY